MGLVRQYKPGGALTNFVEVYWEGRFTGHPHKGMSMRVIPSGFVDLIIHLSDLHCDLHNEYGWDQSPDYTVIGLYTRPYEVQFQDKVDVFAIRFKPEGFFNVFGVPSSLFKEGFDDMSLVLGADFQAFCDQLKQKASASKAMIRLANGFLLRMIDRNQVGQNYVNRAAELIRQTKGGLKIEDLSRRMNISLRQLEREFKDKVGLTPKQYLRLSRMNEVHRLLEQHKWLNLTQVAYQSGYADQAHFIRDFKSITGEKPTVFIKERNRYLVTTGWEQARNEA